jgi:autotransporter-associated beta strand protein
MELNPSGSSTVVTWYSTASGNADLGSAKGTFTTTKTIASFNDSADNLGRSFYSADSTANASYNEVRFWNGALSSNILEILHDAGPNADLNSLNIGAPGSLPSTTDVNITGSGATLDLNNISQTVGSLSGVDGSSVLLGSGTLTIGGNASTTFSGVISGTGGIIKNGTGILTLTGNPTYTGNTVINSGGLQLDAGITTLTTISGQGELIVGGAGTTTQLTASSITVGTLTIGANSTSAMSPTAGGPLGDLPASMAVPEPGVWIMLLIAAAAVCLKRR